MRKSNPLGSKFKNIVNEMAGIIIWLEIQEGKDCMHKEMFSEKFGGTAACVMRGIRNTSMFKHHISEKDDDDNEEIGES